MSTPMNTYTTFHKLMDYLQMFQEQSPIMNTFGYGNLVDFGKNISGSTVQYPFLFVVPQAIEYQDNMTVYNCTMIFADILNWDLSNELDCVSDMSLQARRFLSYVKLGLHTFPELYDNIDINMPVQALPFFERFGDHVAGVAMEVPLIVYEDINACNYYEDITPTPTPTITATPTTTPLPPSATPTTTPTVTPTKTSTPTVTPTSTITSTPTQTPGVSPSATPTITPTKTSTPTPTPTSNFSLSFLVCTGATKNDACACATGGGTLITVYAEDLGNCGPCSPNTCWACLTTSQQVYLDYARTQPVPNGYYTNNMGGGFNYGTWNIVGGFPQGGGFSGGC